MKFKLVTAALAGASLACALSASAASINVVDLTTAGASGTANGALFQQISPQTTGTGVIDPFLRVQANRTEEGFNNNVNAFTLDDIGKGGGNFNHDIQLSKVPQVTINGTAYYQFLLDINQNKDLNKDGNLLSLDQLQIWLKSTPITTFAGNKGVLTDLTGSGAVEKYDLDGAGDAYVKMDFTLNPGSGAGDMFANIPVGALGTDGSQYVYLYSLFGSNNASNDGFEEWATIGQPGTTTVPAGGTTVVLLGSALSAMALLRRKLS